MSILLKNVTTITGTLFSLSMFSLAVSADDVMLGTGGYNRVMHDMK